MNRPLAKVAILERHQPGPSITHWLREELRELYSDLFGGQPLSRQAREIERVEVAYQHQLAERQREHQLRQIQTRLWLDTGGLR